MKQAIVFLLIIAAAVPEAQAQVSQAQQCVWSCLYGPGGGDPASPAYHQCVNQNCAGLEDGAGNTAINSGAGQDPTVVWQSGQMQDGTRYAGIDLPGYAGRAGLYYFCRRGGRSYFALFGLDGGAVPMRFLIDQTLYSVRFHMGSGGNPEVDVPSGAPLMLHLQSGGFFQLQMADGRPISNLSLGGSKQALAQAITYC